MATPKLDKTATDQLRRFLDDYHAQFEPGGYTEKVRKYRTDHALDFILFLEGKFSPLTDKGKPRRS